MLKWEFLQARAKGKACQFFSSQQHSPKRTSSAVWFTKGPQQGSEVQQRHQKHPLVYTQMLGEQSPVCACIGLDSGPTYVLKARHLFKALPDFRLCLAQWKECCCFAHLCFSGWCMADLYSELLTNTIFPAPKWEHKQGCHAGESILSPAQGQWQNCCWQVSPSCAAYKVRGGTSARALSQGSAHPQSKGLTCSSKECRFAPKITQDTEVLRKMTFS